MLILPTDHGEAESLLMAISRLAGSSLDFKRVMIWFQNNGEWIASANKEEKDEINLRWNQGAMQLIDSFMSICDRSRALAEKYRS